MTPLVPCSTGSSSSLSSWLDPSSCSTSCSAFSAGRSTIYSFLFFFSLSPGAYRETERGGGETDGGRANIDKYQLLLKILNIMSQKGGTKDRRPPSVRLWIQNHFFKEVWLHMYYFYFPGDNFNSYFFLIIHIFSTKLGTYKHNSFRWNNQCVGQIYALFFMKCVVQIFITVFNLIQRQEE